MLLCRLLLGSIWTFSVVASAQTSVQPAPSGPALASADACARDPVCWFHVERARELSKQGQLDDALKEYQLAFGMQPMPRLIFNIARIQQKTGRLDEALRSYELYLNLGAEGNQEFATKAKSYIDEIHISTEPPPAPLIPPPPPPTPLYKRWRFWGGLGLAIAATTAAVSVAIVFSRPDPTQNLTIFRPF